MSTTFKKYIFNKQKKCYYQEGLNKMVINMLLECFSNHW